MSPTIADHTTTLRIRAHIGSRPVTSSPMTGSDGDDAVTTARFTWDGRDLRPDDQDGRPGLPPSPEA